MGVSLFLSFSGGELFQCSNTLTPWFFRSDGEGDVKGYRFEPEAYPCDPTRAPPPGVDPPCTDHRDTFSICSKAR